MHNKEYLIKNACYSVTKYYLCKQNNKRSLLGRKQRSQVARSFPNRYQFSCTNKVTSLFSDRYIFIIILVCKTYAFGTQNNRFCNALIVRELRNRYSCEKYLHFYCVFSVLILRCFLLVVIRFALDNAARTIELFHENKAHHLVGESHFRKRNLFVGTVVHCF